MSADYGSEVNAQCEDWKAEVGLVKNDPGHHYTRRPKDAGQDEMIKDANMHKLDYTAHAPSGYSLLDSWRNFIAKRP